MDGRKGGLCCWGGAICFLVFFRGYVSEGKKLVEYFLIYKIIKYAHDGKLIRRYSPDGILYLDENVAKQTSK